MIDPVALVEQLGPDAARYFLLREAPYGADWDFTDAAFVARYNADLANDLGNLVSRALTMAARYCDGKVPPRPAAGGDARGRVGLERDAAPGRQAPPGRRARSLRADRVRGALGESVVVGVAAQPERSWPWSRGRWRRTPRAAPSSTRSSTGCSRASGSSRCWPRRSCRAPPCASSPCSASASASRARTTSPGGASRPARRSGRSRPCSRASTRPSDKKETPVSETTPPAAPKPEPRRRARRAGGRARSRPATASTSPSSRRSSCGRRRSPPPRR